jgi:hypothetical protein
MLEGCSGCCLAVILIPVLCIGLVACGAIYMTTNAPAPPLSSNFTPSPAEARAFDTVLADAVGRASREGTIVVQFTERDLSSWMALEGRTFAEEQGHVFPFDDVQVGLDDGAFHFYGKLNQSRISVPVGVTIEPRINGTGHVEFAITSVDVGGIRAPDFVLRNVRDQFQEVLIQPFENLPGDYFLYDQSLRLQDGTFAVQGYVR